MCPTIEISQHIFNELQSIAVPLVDTPDTIIARLLHVYNGGARADASQCPRIPHVLRSSESTIGKDSILRFHADKLPDVTHTTFISGRVDVHSANDWNHLMLLAHAIAFDRLGKNIDSLKTASPANIKPGEQFAQGFKYIKDYPFSVQGVEANKACSIACKLAIQFEFPIAATFRWQEKERAAYPGKTGCITVNDTHR